MPDDLGPTCHFDGESSQPCGKCIAASCQPQVDEVCSHDTSLELEVKNVDKCATGQSCSSVDSKLKACLEVSCASVCTLK